MAENTNIEWCDATFNPWIGCTKVSPACDHCYAEVSTPARTLQVQWGAKADRHRTSAANWKLPIRWNAEHDAFFAVHGHRRRVFCASLADVFDNDVPPAWRQELMSLVADTPNLDWLFLTKRIGNAKRMLASAGMHDGRLLTANDEYRLPANLWIGATICNQEEADRDIPKLLEVPARVRFLSIEPMLGHIDLTAVKQTVSPGFFGDCLEWYHRPHGITTPWPAANWVIAGGESGPRARPMHPDWARALRDQCAAAGVPFLFKQWGEWRTMTMDEQRANRDAVMRGPTVAWPDGTIGYGDHRLNGGRGKPLFRLGKQAAGRLLDGVTHDGFPEVRHG